MEVANEISQRIKSAIKAKLVDLGAYVDDELPDYIMVMVANRKSKAQMTEDLNLFLGENTDAFTTWLDTLLQKLKSISITNATQSATSAISTTSTTGGTGADDRGTAKPAKSQSEQGEADITLMPDDDDFEEVEASSKATAGKQPGSALEEINRANQVIVERRMGVAPARHHKSPDHREHSSSDSRYRDRDNDRLHTSRGDQSRQTTRRVGSVVGSHFKKFESDEESEEEYDPVRPMIGKVASQVFVRDRRRMPASQQANKALLLKAVDAAHRSTGASSSSRGSRYRYRSRSTSRERVLQSAVTGHIKSRLGRRDHYTHTISSMRADEECHSRRASERERQHRGARGRDWGRDRESRGGARGGSRYRRDSNSPAETRRIQVHHSPKQQHTSDEKPTKADPGSDVEMTDDPYSPSRRSASPNFVVTLDGVDPKKMKLLGEEEDEARNEDVDVDGESVVTDKGLDMSVHHRLGRPLQQQPHLTKQATVVKVKPQLKVDTFIDEDEEILVELDSNDEGEDVVETRNERCRFWPNCKAKDSCVFYHPTVPCRNFPRCTFGDKCLYIHPQCKFDQSCNRSACPFTHTHKRTMQPPYQVMLQPMKVPMMSMPPPNPRFSKPKFTKESFSSEPHVCKFYPNCSNVDCTFFHPLPCRYGMSCTKKATCKFTHPDLPTKEKLKWRAAPSSSSSAAPSGVIISLDADA